MRTLAVRLAIVIGVSGLISACSVSKESMSMFLAKEMCSCRFLIEQSDAHCRSAVRLGLAMGDVSVDMAAKSVTGTDEKGLNAATFKFVSGKLGCELVK